MARRRVRLGIRAQLTLTVLLGALLSTAATLFIARNAISTYAFKQAETQAFESMSIATLVMQTAYGQNISISSDSGPLDNNMVLDSPSVGRDQGTSFTENNKYGKYPLNEDTEYTDAVQSRVHGAVSVYQCADKSGNQTPCLRIATTFTKAATSGMVSPRDTGTLMCQQILNSLQLGDPNSPHEWVGIGEDPNGHGCGSSYYGDFKALYNPAGQFIGVLYVGVPLDTVTAFENSTALELLLLGVIVMTAGAVLALLFASAIVNALQRAARHVSSSSERIAGIAAQQSGGAAQQVWAVNAVNKALQNFQEMARDIAGRTDQLALMGNQVISRRGEISPAQIDSILAYMTRSVRDISVASRQQATQFERMSGAMQAVIEIAEQVAGNSQQSSESAERLQLVVRQLQQLVGVSPFARRGTRMSTSIDALPAAELPGGWGGQDMRVAGARGRSRQQLGVVPYGPAGGYQPAPYGAYGNNAPNDYGGYGEQYGGRPDGGYPDGGYPGGSYAGGGYTGGGGYPGGSYNGYGGQNMMPPPPGSAGVYGGQSMASGNWIQPPPPGAMSGGMPGGMRGGATGPARGAPDWRLPPMPPLPAMPPMGNDQAGQQAPGFGGPGGPGGGPNGPAADGDGWGGYDPNNEPRRSWAGERGER